MTREEINKRIMQACKNMWNEKVCKEIEDALEPCEDAIDRAEAMTEIMMFAGNVKSDEEDIYIKVSDAVQLLRELPSVTPHQRIGHWIDIMVGDMPAQACDQCNTFYPLAYTGGGHKYCPNCGAEMEENK